MASLFVVLAYSVCRCQSEQKQMILTIEMDSLVLTEGDEAEIRLRIHGITSKINSYTFRLEYEMASKFRKQRMRKKKNIVWNPQEGDSITLSEMITECDSYHIQICSVSWEDLTGMYKVKKEFNKQISFLVMPKRYEMGFMQEKIARRDLMEQGFEYDGVRKYQEGDRISRVHWNLYAATGGLWVRKNEEEEEERVAKEDRSMVRESVTEDEIAKIISRWTGIPVAKLTESERKGITEVSKPETLANLYGFEYVDTQNGFNIYENKYYVPMGFTYDYYCLDSDIQKASEVDKTSMLMKALVLTPEQAAKYNNILSYYSFKGTDYSTDQYYQNCLDRRANSCSSFSYDSYAAGASTPRSTLTRITLCSSQFHMMTAGAQR